MIEKDDKNSTVHYSLEQNGSKLYNYRCEGILKDNIKHIKELILNDDAEKVYDPYLESKEVIEVINDST